mmetsp:Transcript_27029/g.76044  ORF Transcript_27029/g.76044 Transcript_27029/m.76044 type:complete len:556 (-) Transcript_27029:118-1785(-)
MASITAGTKHKMPAKKSAKVSIGKASSKASAGTKRGAVVKLKPSKLATAPAVADLKALDDLARRNKVQDLYREAIGETVLIDKSKPRTESTSRSRGMAAADLAIACNELGISYVLRACGILDEMQRMLFPDGIESMFSRLSVGSGGLKPSTSAASLTSLGDATMSSAGSFGTDTKRGKGTPANAREGSLLIIRALCEKLGKKVEPYVVGAFLAASLDECGSNSSNVRQAAEDTATALIQLANPWVFSSLISPLLLQSLKSTEWRVKLNALDRLGQCANTAPSQVCRMLPTLIPAVTDQVWDTKQQVTKAASSTLLKICKTITNPDVAPAIPAVVKAISKPSETIKAIEELMGTTFVVSVDAPTLSILCPVLSRALKEKLAIHKRSACIVISNMSRLVSTPEDVAPFGPLLVPELKKVATNVQFEEIRDEALKALKNLTKALGDAFDEDQEAKAQEAELERERVEAEQKRIQDERDAEAKREAELKKKEEEERKRFKEAMDAQRELAKMEAEKARKEKEEEQRKKEAAKLSTKGAAGKCQGCGLKKCKPTCHFYSK